MQSVGLLLGFPDLQVGRGGKWDGRDCRKWRGWKLEYRQNCHWGGTGAVDAQQPARSVRRVSE